MVGWHAYGSAIEVAFAMFLYVGEADALDPSRREAEERPTVSVLGLPDPRLTRAVSQAVRDARARLESAECRRIFSDFSDSSGLSLDAKLEAAGEDGQSYLGWLIFRNGSREAFCDRDAVTLAAQPGARFVMVCGARFLPLQTGDPAYAAVLVLHEELHVLGLGENPPSSAEITARVISRCGR